MYVLYLCVCAWLTRCTVASPDWLPFYPTEPAGVYCSLFPADASALFLCVERYNRNITGTITLSAADYGALQFFDAYHGSAISPNKVNGSLQIDFEIEANGYGAIFATKQLTAPLKAFLIEMANLTQLPLSAFSSEWTPLQVPVSHV